MTKSLHSRHNQILLELLRRRRISVPLRQADLALLLGRHQGTVSKTETGERRLDVIELRDWLLAMGVGFVDFMSELDQRLEGSLVVDATLRSVDPRRRGSAGPSDHSR